jgi:hypothetical protein
MPTYTILSSDGNASRLATLMEEMGVSYSDLFKVFDETAEILYFKGDSHWNGKGAALAADALMADLGLESPGYYAGSFTAAAPHTGDLYEMLYPAGRETEADFAPASGFTFRYTSPSSDPDAITLTTENPNGTGTLLCYRDSFGMLLFPYLADSYGEAKFSRAVNYDLTGGESFVAIELVERNLRYLIQNVPVMPSPVRRLEIPAESRGSIQVTRAEKARAGNGCVQLTGQLTEKPDANSCVYVVCGGIVYEAFCLEKDGFAVNVPEGAKPESVLYYIGGTLQMFEIQ